MKQPYVAFSGGGVRSVALIGALKFLHLSGIKPKGFAGTSAGSILAALAANEWAYEDIKEFVLDINFGKLIKFDPVGFLAHAGRPKGLMDSKKLGKVFDKLQAEGRLRKVDNLWINAVETDERKERIFSGDDFETIGYGSIIQASTAIPAVIKPAVIQGEEFMDGGTATNPCEPPLGPGDRLWVFHCGYASRAEVPHNWVESITNTIDALCYYRDKFRFESADQIELIKIPVMDVRSTDFNLPRKKKEELIEYGYAKTLEALDIKKIMGL